MILMIDNYDSFTYIIVQYLQQLGQQVKVITNEEWSLEDICAYAPKAIIIGPGPGRPEDAGRCVQIIKHFAANIPILGICLGHQAIALAFDAKIVQASTIMHGRTSAIFHDREGIFKGLPSPVDMTRYHSLIVDKTTLPATLVVTAWTQNGNLVNTGLNRMNNSINEIMAIRHLHYAVEGVQFHPESILSHAGLELLSNFLTMYRSK